MNAIRRVVDWPVSGGRSADARPRTDSVAGAVYVLATSLQGTRMALLGAREHARKAGAEVVLVVPCVVPEREPVDRPTRSPGFIGTQYQRLAEELGTDLHIRLCLCRSFATAISAMLPNGATVFLGGTGRVWWPTPEQRLATRLSRSGREVVFVAARKETSAWGKPSLPPTLRSRQPGGLDRLNQ